MKKFRHFLEYLFFLSVGFLARLLPYRLALDLGARFGDFGFYCVPIRKQVALANLARAFPEKSVAERQKIARQVYRNLGIMTIEHLRFPRMTPEDLLALVEFENISILENALKRGKGVIITGGHFGNWEIMGCSISAAGHPTSFVVADIHNRFLDRMINDHRRLMGVKIIPKGMAIRGIMKDLAANRCVTILIDQDAGKQGTFVEFLGQLASTPKGPATFALKTGAALILTLSFRQPNGRLKVVFEEILTNDFSELNDESINQITQRATTRLEQQIRAYPDHWFWMHRRWKTQLPTTENERES